MQQTPRSIRYAIAIVGRTNAGKSALINAICEQEVAIVSEIAGTTTDSVGKAYELTGFGPVMFYDTAGLQDNTELGEKRMKSAIKTLSNSDMAVIVIGDGKPTPTDEEIIAKAKALNIPHLVVYNKMDLYPTADGVKVSATLKQNISELKQEIIKTIPHKKEKTVLDGLVKQDDVVLLVAPIDSAAPKGRLIMPQIVVLREILDEYATAIVVQPEQVKSAIKLNPSLVITDSQALHKIEKDIPQHIALTTFSILFGRNKGDFNLFLEGARKIDSLQDGDKVLIAEACSHTTTADDIAREQFPKLLTKYTGKKLEFDFTQGRAFPENITDFALVLHCGSCMLTQKETLNRLYECKNAGVAVTNYGMTFAKCQNMLERTVEMLQKKNDEKK